MVELIGHLSSPGQPHLQILLYLISLFLLLMASQMSNLNGTIPDLMVGIGRLMMLILLVLQVAVLPLVQPHLIPQMVQ